MEALSGETKTELSVVQSLTLPQNRDVEIRISMARTEVAIRGVHALYSIALVNIQITRAARDDRELARRVS